ncbi:MAG: 2-oxoacid:acceptor oxidoreductase subunit alpha [Saprospiraceae bacterium]|nr:2-oxoacid:acceptor oxidoreductase subunit alpha [Saprospiraceae bacterium]
MSVGNVVNDFVIRFANVNGTGSASANGMFAKSLFRMGLPISPKNIFPSNIQGLPTWYEIRVSESGFLGRRDGVDVVVGVNPQSLMKDIESVKMGGYFIYDSSKKLHEEFLRDDIHFIGIPMIRMSMDHFEGVRKQQLFKNVVYVGALVALLDMDVDTVKKVVADQFKSKPKLIPPNYQALELGYNYAKEHYKCPLSVKVEMRAPLNDKIIIDGNTATGLGLIYGGATVAAWYPITPSTSVTQSFEKYAQRLRIDPETGKHLYAVVQAEDELAAIGMVIGASWNGARAFTATAGPGVSLMNEFIGLAYFAEIPVALINVQRGGPSTGMPTRTQQGDVLSSAYASHGDCKHPLLFPSTPTECFEMAAMTLDLADRLQTVVIMMSDLDLGMNEHMTDELTWDEEKKYDRGKVLTAEDLEEAKDWGRYLDVDGDGIPYRTYPGTHPTKGSYFTRGTSKNEYARYTEDGTVYARNVERLLVKWDTAKDLVPAPEFYQDSNKGSVGMIFYGTTTYSATEAMVRMEERNIFIDSMRLKGFPFNKEVERFVEDHETIYVIEQNRDAQMRMLLINELDIIPAKLIPICNYDGMPITADFIYKNIYAQLVTTIV